MNSVPNRSFRIVMTSDRLVIQSWMALFQAPTSPTQTITPDRDLRLPSRARAKTLPDPASLGELPILRASIAIAVYRGPVFVEECKADRRDDR